jgi:hypothetical protein
VPKKSSVVERFPFPPDLWGLNLNKYEIPFKNHYGSDR